MCYLYLIIYHNTCKYVLQIKNYESSYLNNRTNTLRIPLNLSLLSVYFSAAVVIIALTHTQTAASKEQIFINYDYMNNIDIGGYQTTGLSSRDLKIPISYTYRFRGDKNWRLRFKTDLNFGRYKFKGLSDEDTQERANVNAFSIVPGIQLIIPLRDYWSIVPFVQYGLGWGAVTNRSPGFDPESPLTYTFNSGVKNIFSWDLNKFQFKFGNEISSGGNGTFDGKFTDVFAKIKFGLAVNHPLGFSIGSLDPDIGTYGTYTRYLPNTEFPLLLPNDLEVDDQYEIGIGVGFGNRIRLEHESKLVNKVINLPLKLLKKRLVVAYRFGDNIKGIIIRFNVPL